MARERDVHQLVKSRMEKNLHEGEWGCWEDRVTVFFPGLECIMSKGNIRAQNRRKSACYVMPRPGNVRGLCWERLDHQALCLCSP